MSESNSFGVILPASRIEIAAKALIAEWYDDYILEVARVLGLATDYFPLIDKGEILSLAEFEQEGRSYRSPTFIVTSPGVEGTPVQEGDGTYRARFLLGVGMLSIVPFSPDRAGDSAKAMAAAVRSMFLQHKSLGLDFVLGMTWLGESYDDRQTPDDQTMSEAYLRFSIDVIGVADALTIPSRTDTPLADPTVDPGPYETATTVNTTIAD